MVLYVNLMYVNLFLFLYKYYLVMDQLPHFSIRVDLVYNMDDFLQ